MIELFDEVTAKVDEGHSGIYTNYLKVFDKVPHDRLVSKVEALGMKEIVAAWISIWLSHRKQTCGECLFFRQQEGKLASPRAVLGPLPTLTYIIDLDLGVQDTISKFR